MVRCTPNKTFDVLQFKDHINSLLESTLLSQQHKKALCETVEYVLKNSRNYNNYSYLYWYTIGFKEWHLAGMPEGKEKDKYIYGPIKKEYDRHYY